LCCRGPTVPHNRHQIFLKHIHCASYGGSSRAI
jgi:hypothetical protein